ncbi:MAG: hypothetical protein AMXMBFR44_1230 [Candidatus Campbellbacteria bacterium]
MSPFKEITDRNAWGALVGKRSPFLERAWEDALSSAFPYIHFKYFLYRDGYAVRVAAIRGRATTVPFSDGGDVVALSGEPLLLSKFRDDCLAFFGPSCTLRVHESFCPVADRGDLEPDVMDYRIALPNFGVESIRKTLRHILSEEVPQEVSIRTAQTPRDMRDAYRLYLRTMRAAKAFALPFSTFAHFSHDDVYLFLVNGNARAASVFLTEKNTAHYFISASDRAGKNLHAPHHLLFHALAEYQKRGFQSVFLGGVRAGSPLQTFKEGWRGTPCGMYTITDNSAHEKARRSPLRALWGLIPLVLLPKASKLAGKYVL